MSLGISSTRLGSAALDSVVSTPDSRVSLVKTASQNLLEHVLISMDMVSNERNPGDKFYPFVLYVDHRVVVVFFSSHSLKQDASRPQS